MREEGGCMSKFIVASLPDPLYERIEEYVREHGFISKAEFLRFLIHRELLKEKTKKREVEW